jgi:hypothetical protein
MKKTVQRKHPQVEIEIQGEKIEVDREIAPLVEALNKLPGVDTCSSCQSSRRGQLVSAYVNFNVSDAEGDEADDPSICRLLRRIEAALRRSQVWARVSLNFTPDYPPCQVECAPANIVRIAEAMERLALKGDVR